MSKRSRPQPITTPGPESFLPTFDFGSPPPQKKLQLKPKKSSQSPTQSHPLPPRKSIKQVPLSKRLAAFTFVNLEGIVEERETEVVVDNIRVNDAISPLAQSPAVRSPRFWEFSRQKPILPPITSPSSTILSPVSPVNSISPVSVSTQRRPSVHAVLNKEDNPKSLAVDLVSIFSVADETDTSRFSFPMPPSFTPRRGSQSPLDPDLSFTATTASFSSLQSPSSAYSAMSDYSFLSPLFSAPLSDETPLSPETFMPTMADVKKERRITSKSRRTLLVPLEPPAPPPGESPPPTPTTPSRSPSRLEEGPKPRVCPSPDLDPDFSAYESSASPVTSAQVSEAEDSENEGRVRDYPPVSVAVEESLDIFANWRIGAPSRSGSIATITPRTLAAMRSRSISAADRHGSMGSGEMYENWDQAIDDIFALVASRKPSLQSMAFAASVEGAAAATTSLRAVEDMAFVLDDEMLKRLNESQFLVASRPPPSPPSVSSASARSSFDEERPSMDVPMSIDALNDDIEGRTSFEMSPTFVREPSKTRPTAVVASDSYPPVDPLRLKPKKEHLSASTNSVSLRPPPSQSVPDENALFSPVFSPLSPSKHNTAFSPVDLDNWPTWSAIDLEMDNRRRGRRPSAGAITAISKFSDDSVDVRTKRRRRQVGKLQKTEKVEAAPTPSPTSPKQAKPSRPSLDTNLKPGSSYTSYTFLGMKKKKDSPTSEKKDKVPFPKAMSPVSPVSVSVLKKGSSNEREPRISIESARSSSSNEGRSGLRRPAIPLELFIRA